METRLTLSNKDGEYSVFIRDEDLSVGEMFADLIVPVLLAAGYSKDTIDIYLAN